MQNGNGGDTVGIGEFGSNGMYMLPLGVGREASLGKGCYLIDVLSGDGMITDGMTQVRDVIEIEIIKLVLHNRVEFFILVEGEDDDVFSDERPFILGQVLTNIMHRVVEDRINGLHISFFPFFIYNKVAVIIM
jgi:hypothetical protein